MTTPRWISPMLATLHKEPFSDKEWIFEEKFDGIRCLAVKKAGRVTLYSRNHKNLSAVFPEIVSDLESRKSKNYVADGEIVAFNKKVTSFSKLQSRLNVLDVSHIKGVKVPVYFYIFDLLFWDRRNLKNLSLLERKKALKNYFPFGKAIRYTPHVEKSGAAFFQKATDRGLEGIMAKRKTARYVGKRSRDWLKIKSHLSQEFVIGGYTNPQGSRIGFGALLIGYYEKTALRYAGKVGTGYDKKMLKALSKKLKSLQITHPVFKDPIKECHTHFVSPRLVCEIAFTEWTKEGKLRHPRFLGMRKDKAAKSVIREK